MIAQPDITRFGIPYTLGQPPLLMIGVIPPLLVSGAIPGPPEMTLIALAHNEDFFDPTLQDFRERFGDINLLISCFQPANHAELKNDLLFEQCGEPVVPVIVPDLIQ